MYEFRDPYIIDFTNVETYHHMHFIIRDAMDWPEYYGCNWDAFWDLLTEMAGETVHIEIRGFDVLENKFAHSAQMMKETLQDFIHYNDDAYIDDIRIEIYRGEMKERLT